jgi:hypothetical protein
MKKLMFVAVAMMLLLSTVTSAGADSTKILKFDTLVGVPRPYTGATNAIRGVPGGGRPWVVAFADGSLKVSGKLEIIVQGLVIDPNEPVATAGTNPSPSFRAIVSCLSKDSAGLPTTVNVMTDPFPADAAGNSTIETRVTLPQPCIAPIIFVTNAGGTSWFAATGF